MNPIKCVACRYSYVVYGRAVNPTWCMARLEGFEPPAHGLEVRSSIHLSYRRSIAKYTTSLSFRQVEFGRTDLSPLSH